MSKLNFYWFYKLDNSDDKWIPFCNKDSKNLQDFFNEKKLQEKLENNFTTDQNYNVPVKAGRFDANLSAKKLKPVFWDAEYNYGFIKQCKYVSKNEVYDAITEELVKKIDWTQMDQEENDRFDHLCFVVHGMGEVCDIPFRPILDCANSMKDISNSILNSNETQFAKYKCVEFLPISWHQVIHTDKEKWKNMSLSSLPKLRSFFNTAISDILYYSDQKYKQGILNKVKDDLNRYVTCFKQRNTYFNGKISIIGHSLGSLIVFDLLSNLTDELGLNVKLDFKIDNFFAIGSPISLFLTTRGINLENNLKLKCDNFFNIYHQLDPFAYRIEPILNKNVKLDAKVIKKYTRDSFKTKNISTFNEKKELNEKSNFNFQFICQNANKELDDHNRIDFEIEKSNNDLLDYVYFIKAHSYYWDSCDLVNFVLENLYK